MGKIKTFDTQSDYDVAYNTGALEYPNLSKVRSNNKIYVKVNDNAHDHYLTFEALSGGTVNLKTTNASRANTFQYSTNDGKTWNSITASTTLKTIATLSQGQKLLMKANNIQNGEWNNGSNSFWGNQITGGSAHIKMYGNINSLVWGDDFIDNDEFPKNTFAPFMYLFYNYANLYDVADVILPAKNIPSGTYMDMFHSCTNITVAPYIQARTMVGAAMQAMFSNCTKLSTGPEILYPKILTGMCYRYMFEKCSSLTRAPILPALNLVSNCYAYMFKDCTNLNYIKAMFLTTPETSYTNAFLPAGSSSKIFVKNRKATWNSTGGYGTNGWTIQYVDE